VPNVISQDTKNNCLKFSDSEVEELLTSTEYVGRHVMNEYPFRNSLPVYMETTTVRRWGSLNLLGMKLPLSKTMFTYIFCTCKMGV